MIRQARQIASVWSMTLYVGPHRRSLLAHHQLRVHPQPSTNSGHRREARQSTGEARHVQLQVVAG